MEPRRRRAPEKDARGYSVGGEEADYEDLVGGLGRFLRGLDGQIPTR